jgi:hypothetical protein
MRLNKERSLVMRGMVVLALALSAPACGNDKAWEEADFVPSEGFVPDEETAISIAKAVWVPIYGDRVLEKSPFYADLVDGVWHVRGSLPEGYIGGVPMAKIEKKTGKVLGVIHGQ